MRTEEAKFACIVPLSRTPYSVGHCLAIDTEDDTHGNLIVACLYGSYLKRKHRGKEIVRVEETFYNRKDLNKFLSKLQTPSQRFPACTLVGFNMAYDLAYIDEIVDYSTVLESGARFISCTLQNGVEVIDISNHSGKTLDHWITELKMGEKGIVKTEWRKDMPLDELTSHCQNDVRGTWELAEFFRETYERIGVSFRLTTSSAALDLFKRQFFTGQMWRRKIALFNDLEKNAYYGGRTECFKRGVERVKSYDINSAYVSAMSDGLYPKPDSARYNKGSRHFLRHYRDPNSLLIVHCQVFAPKSRVMVLPFRDEESKKLLFPWGKFEGWWCSPELREAEKYGYKILKVYDYIYYSAGGYYFRDYANYTWEQRHIAAEAGDDGMKTVWKLFGNGLYGKLAQRNSVGGRFVPEILFGGDEPDRPIIHTAANGVKWYSCPSTKKIWSTNSFPCISAFITCYTRLKLLDYLKRHEKDVLYCDTDSIKIPWNGLQEKSSKELGKVKYEADNSGWFCFIKPKLYGRVPKSFANLPENYDFQTPIPITHLYFNPDEDRWTIKGVGKYEFAYFDFTDMTFHTAFTKPNRFKESVRRGLTRNEWTQQEKDLTLLDDKREWKCGSRDSEPRKLNGCKTILTQDDNI